MKRGKKSLIEMTTEELLEELRNSQGPGDALVEINPKSGGVRITAGKTVKKPKDE